MDVGGKPVEFCCLIGSNKPRVLLYKLQLHTCSSQSCRKWGDRRFYYVKLFFHPKYFPQWQPNKSHHQVGKDQFNVLFSNLLVKYHRSNLWYEDCQSGVHVENISNKFVAFLLWAPTRHSPAQRQMYLNLPSNIFCSISQSLKTAFFFFAAVHSRSRKPSTCIEGKHTWLIA